MTPISMTSLSADSWPVRSSIRPDVPSLFQQSMLSIKAPHTDELQDAASKLVSSALVMPALSSLQSSMLRPKDGPFAPGAAERRFAPLLHAEFADRVTSAARFGLVNAIVARFGGESRSTMETFA